MQLRTQRTPVSVFDDPLAGLCAPVPAWHADAACAEHPELTWFPERGGDTRAAKAVCGGCLVRNECLAYALENGEHFGIWGGLTVNERAALGNAS